MNIKLDLTATPFDGQIVTFTAPCGCDAVTDGLIINGETYTVCDAMGNCVTGKGGAWCSGAQVSVVLDVTNKKAYIQNQAGADYTETDPTVPAWAKAASKPTYTASEVGADASGSAASALASAKAYADGIKPTKTSQLTNDSGFITGYTETDPTVPAWAKAASKPTYTASEVGAATMTEVNAAIATAIGTAIGGSY